MVVLLLWAAIMSIQLCNISARACCTSDDAWHHTQAQMLLPLSQGACHILNTMHSAC
jgi:hypothetical protein